MAISIRNSELEICGYGDTLEKALCDYKTQIRNEHTKIRKLKDSGRTTPQYLEMLKKEIDSWKSLEEM